MSSISVFYLKKWSIIWICWFCLVQFPVWIKKVIVSDKFLGCNYKTRIIKWSVKKYNILRKQNSTKLTQCWSIKEQYFFWLCSNLKGGGQKQVRVFTKRAVNWQVESPFKNSFQSVGRFFIPIIFLEYFCSVFIILLNKVSIPNQGYFFACQG